MAFRVLVGGQSDAEWSALVRGLAPELRDLHFLPEYGRIYSRVFGQQHCLAVHGDDERYVIQPFVRRSLRDLPFLRDAAGGEDTACDIANAYGYGGPVARSGSVEEACGLCRVFEESFVAHGVAARYASEFSSLHPFLDAQAMLASTGTVDLRSEKEVVYVDLDGSEAGLWAGLRKGHKSSVKKAARSGISIDRVVPDEQNLRTLNRLYRETMVRNGAAARWYFPDDYFRACFEELGDARCSLFVARCGDEVAAAAIVLHDFMTAYYHFSGSDIRFADRCANNLLVYEIARWAGEHGYRRLHLGGGVTSDATDSLLVFKGGFSDRRATLWTYGRVLNRMEYERLCDLKRAHEALSPDVQIQRPDFFPLYRR